MDPSTNKACKTPDADSAGEGAKAWWRRPAFVRLFSGQVLSLFGSRLSLIVLFQIVFSAHGRAWDLGKAAVLLAVPVLLLSPVAGWVADRFHRVTVVVTVHCGRALLTVAYLWATELSHFYVLIFLNGCLQTLSGPSFLSLYSDVLEGKGLVRANSARVVVTNLVSVVGPPVGALLYSFFGKAPVFLADAATFVLAGVLVATIGRKKKARKTAQESTQEEVGGGVVKKSGFWAGYHQAWRFLRSRRAFFFFPLPRGHHVRHFQTRR